MKNLPLHPSAELRALFGTLALAAVVATPVCSVAAQDRYQIDVDLDAGSSATSMQLEIDFNALAGAFAGQRDLVECVPNPDIDALFAFNLCDPAAPSGCKAEGQLNAAFASLQSIEGPVRLFSCSFDTPSEAPRADRFVVRVVEASEGSGNELRETLARASVARVAVANAAEGGER